MIGYKHLKQYERSFMSIEILAVLECVAAQETQVSTSVIQQETGIPPATLTRIFTRLCSEGYLQKEGRGLYSIGARFLSLSAAAMDHSFLVRFLPFLKELVASTGLNAELYNLTARGPQLINWEGGVSEFQPRMANGHRVFSDAHPVSYFYRHLRKCDHLWGRSGNAPTVTDEERQRFLQQAREDNFVIERGHIRPELARACAASPDGQYVFALSGLLSEFRLPDTGLKTLLQEKIASFYAHHPRGNNHE